MLTIGFLDLEKQGDSTILLLPNSSSAIIIDCPEVEPTWNYIKQNQIQQIEVIFLTHFDYDHVGGKVRGDFEGVIKFCNLARKENIKIKEVRYNFPNAAKDGSLSVKSRIILESLIHLDNIGIIERRENRAEASTQLEFFDVKIRIIYPTSNDLEECFVSKSCRNEGCIVLISEYNNKKVLFGADLISKGWKKIVKRGINISANLFRYPHHGEFFEKSTDQKISTKELLALLNPNVTIISANKDDSPKHPNPKTIKELGRLCSIKDNFIFLCTRGMPGQQRSIEGQSFKKFRGKKNLCAG
ncbi:MAG: ComEC/Rec2 family competence protein, partial [Candidatus Hodarchaeota archaeon]